jgi:hypothetical protein
VSFDPVNASLHEAIHSAQDDKSTGGPSFAHVAKGGIPQPSTLWDFDSRRCHCHPEAAESSASRTTPNEGPTQLADVTNAAGISIDPAIHQNPASRLQPYSDLCHSEPGAKPGERVRDLFSADTTTTAERPSNPSPGGAADNSPEPALSLPKGRKSWEAPGNGTKCLVEVSGLFSS